MEACRVCVCVCVRPLLSFPAHNGHFPTEAFEKLQREHVLRALIRKSHDLMHFESRPNLSLNLISLPFPDCLSIQHSLLFLLSLFPSLSHKDSFFLPLPPPPPSVSLSLSP